MSSPVFLLSSAYTTDLLLCVTESIDPEEDTGLPALDAFDRDTGTSIDAFCSAAHGPEAFARPSADVAALARLAAKVGLRGNTAGS